MDHDNTDKELVIARASLWQLLNIAPDVLRLQQELQSRLDKGEVDYVDRAEVARLVVELGRSSDRLAHLAGLIIKLVKLRADTNTKLGEANAIEFITKSALAMRNIVQDMLEPAQYEVFYQRLQQEVLAKMGVKLDSAEKGLKA